MAYHSYRCRPESCLLERGPEELDEKVFADKCAHGCDATTHDLGQIGRPVDVGQTSLPLHVERQQPLAHRLVERSRQRSVMEHP